MIIISYSAEERESLIGNTDEDRTWKIYTLMPTVITKLKRAGMEPTRVDPDGAHYFELDFSQVSFRKKSEGREMSQEQREAASARLRSFHENKNKKDDVE